MMKLSVGLMGWLALVATAAAQERAVRPVGPECVHYLDGTLWLGGGSSGGPRGGDPGGLPETYDVTHAVGSQVPTPQCYLIYNPSLPGAPDDVVTFDGIPETTRTDVFGTVPTVNEWESPPGPPQSQIEIQTSALPGQQLFPGGLFGPQHQPLTDACFYIGLTDPLLGATPRMVVQAFITFSYNGTTVAGPYDVTSFFSNPWNGFFGASLPGGAGSPLNINGVNLHIVVVMSEPPCVYDSDCDDGDQCTVDKCVANVCVHTPLKDTLTREEALRASHGPAKPCFEDGSYPLPPFGSLTFDDAWVTPVLCDGSTQWRIGQTPGDPAIPAGFFDPGSDPFSGTIDFHGAPLGLPQYYDADTLVRRSADPFTRADPPSPTPVTVPIELVQLSLVSCAPITVTYNGGIGPTTTWNVQAGLSACPPPTGSITAVKTHCNGGTFTSVLHVQPRITFTRVDDPLQIRVLDTGCILPPFPFDTLVPPTPSAWVHDISPKLAVADNYRSAFHPGLPNGQSMACGDFDMDDDCDAVDFQALLKSYGHTFTEAGYNPRTDYDTDGVTDFTDYEQWLACYRCSVGNPTAPPPMPGSLGNVNGLGGVNGDDIAAFVTCLTTGGPPFGPCLAADIDQNGVLDLGDVPGFVLLLLVLN